MTTTMLMIETVLVVMMMVIMTPTMMMSTCTSEYKHVFPMHKTCPKHSQETIDVISFYPTVTDRVLAGRRLLNS